MHATTTTPREGGLESPTRHPIPWREPEFYDQDSLDKELQRVFDICHGCRRCVSLCDAFPTLFDLIDESENFDVESVAPEDYPKVSEQCYLCDLCYQTKCPYVPPHPWQLDFPHLMLRAKAAKFRKNGASLRDRIITSTDDVGRLATLPGVAPAINGAARISWLRAALEKILRIHRHAPLPKYRRAPKPDTDAAIDSQRPTVHVFGTCYGRWNRPEINADLIAVLRHNDIQVAGCDAERCCGMPKLELGDLKACERAKEANIPLLAEAARKGHAIVSLVPSCTLMFKQELPLLFPHDEDVALVAKHFHDPFEYLHLRHRAGALRTDFKGSLGKLSYQVACHQRVQNIGQRTRDVLALIPGADIELIERCSGHDGTYAVREETRDKSMKILKPVLRQVEKHASDKYTSDCPLAADYIAHGLGHDTHAPHPISILRRAYGA